MGCCASRNSNSVFYLREVRRPGQRSPRWICIDAYNVYPSLPGIEQPRLQLLVNRCDPLVINSFFYGRLTHCWLPSHPSHKSHPVSLIEALPFLVCKVGFEKPLCLARAAFGNPHLIQPAIQEGRLHGQMKPAPDNSQPLSSMRGFEVQILREIRTMGGEQYFLKDAVLESHQ